MVGSGEGSRLLVEEEMSTDSRVMPTGTISTTTTHDGASPGSSEGFGSEARVRKPIALETPGLAGSTPLADSVAAEVNARLGPQARDGFPTVKSSLDPLARARGAWVF